MKDEYKNKFGMLIDNLKSLDLNKKAISCDSLFLISKVFGIKKTKKLLIPFIEGIFY